MDAQAVESAALVLTTGSGAAVLKEQQVQEIVGRLARGESVSAIAATLGLDRKTVRVWRGHGGWHPRRAGPPRCRRRALPLGDQALGTTAAPPTERERYTSR